MSKRKQPDKGGNTKPPRSKRRKLNEDTNNEFVSSIISSNNDNLFKDEIINNKNTNINNNNNSNNSNNNNIVNSKNVNCLHLYSHRPVTIKNTCRNDINHYPNCVTVISPPHPVSHISYNDTLSSPNVSITGSEKPPNNNNSNNNNNRIRKSQRNEYKKLARKTGQKVRIYWKDDKQWYDGKIQAYNATRNQSLVVYDDGDDEWLSLSNETVEYVFDDDEYDNDINMNGNSYNNRRLLSFSNSLPLSGLPLNIANIGQKGRTTVESLFDHGCIVNTKIGDKTLRGISFDSDYIEYLLHHSDLFKDPFTSQHALYQLLHLCKFDKPNNHLNIINNLNNRSLTQNSLTNRHIRRKNPIFKNKLQRTLKIDCPCKNNDDNNYNYNNNNSNINNIDINMLNNKTLNSNAYLNGIKSNKNLNSKPYVWAFQGMRDMVKCRNNVGRKTTRKNILDLKAIYPISKMRLQNHLLKRKVIIIGAGISGLSCARELMNFGFDVTILESRDRIGGRICTNTTLGLDDDCGSDIGGGWIHGIERNPLTKLVEKLKLTLHSTSGNIQMYNYNGKLVSKELDDKVEKEFNGILDQISKENAERNKRLNKSKLYNKKIEKFNNKTSGNVFDNKKSLNNINNIEMTDNNNNKIKAPKLKTSNSLGETLTNYVSSQKKMTLDEKNLWSWHFSNLEYSNATDLKNLSLTHWDQDDEYAFMGDHCLIKEGYGRIIDALSNGIDIRLNNRVNGIYYSGKRCKIRVEKIELINNNYIIPSNNTNHNNEIKGYMNSNGFVIPQDLINISQSNSVSLSPSNNINGHSNNGNSKKTNKKYIPKINEIDHIKIVQNPNINNNNEMKIDNNMNEKKIVDLPIYALLPNKQKKNPYTPSSYQFVKLPELSGKVNLKEEIRNRNKNNNCDDDKTLYYEADAVVCTVPLGCLKAGHIEFKPKLPGWKQKAINKMGYGLLNKVFIKFKKVFWDISADYIGYASKIHGEFYLFVNLVPVTSTPVLMSLVSGSFAEKLQLLSDNEVVKKALNVLKKIFKSKVSHSDVVDSIVTRWGQDEYSLGSYCHISVNSDGSILDKCAKCINDKIYFAGEGTERKWPASVHGAFLSGLREARKIVHEFYKHEMLVNTNNIEYTKQLSPAVIKCGLRISPIDSIYKPQKSKLIKNINNNNNKNNKNKNNKKKKKHSKRRLRRNHSSDNISLSSNSDNYSNSSDSSLYNNSSDFKPICDLCLGEDDPELLDPLLGPFLDNETNNSNPSQKYYIHKRCAEWTLDIQKKKPPSSSKIEYYNVVSSIKRSKGLKCSSCGYDGASVSCHNEYCVKSYHPLCAISTKWDFDRPDEGKFFYCQNHRDYTLYIKPHITKLKRSKKYYNNKKNSLRDPNPPKIKKPNN